MAKGKTRTRDAEHSYILEAIGCAGKWFEEGGVERVVRVAPLALAVLVFGVLGIIAWHRVSQQQRFLVDAGSVRIGQWPSWCSREMAARINASIPLKGMLNCLDGAATRQVAEAYQASPWVRRVLFVKKQFPNRISVSVDLRQPVLAVPQGNRFYLVDRGAVRLPIQYGQWPVNEVQAAVLVGAQVSPPPAQGAWQDETVLDALAVLGAVKQCGEMNQVRVAAVDVSNLHGRVDPRRSEIVLVTDTQARILWGRSPRREAFGEHSVQEKVTKLGQILRREPRPARVDLVIRFIDGGIVPIS